MPHLFSPLTLRDITFAHRAWMSPMMQFAAVPAGPDTGTPTDWHLQHLGSRAVAGAALVMVEATAVDPLGRSSHYDLGLWNDRQAQSFRRITEFLKAQGTVPGIQIVHAGRKGSTGVPWTDETQPPHENWTTVGPSAVPFGRLPAPTQMSADQIAATVQAFAVAARRAADAGFQALEIHGAHGYLIHQFLSPYSNHRDDRYGGPLEHRMRFALEVAEAVRANWPDGLPLFFRVSATDWLGGDTDDTRPGWTLAETVELAGRLKRIGVDLVDVSSGGSAPDAAIAVAPSYQVPFSTRIRKEVDIPTAAVGLITDAEQADSIIADGEADAVFLARVLLRDPAWISRAAGQLGHELPHPVRYARAFR
ncbi:NADH:flavin oxidoreductase/NADH oxidase [Mycolicibacterium goodii]|uniref:NADH:flavin oxidoreductase/NADH oxidase n=1 Tax=Mycolicibacterium goodii TaxID=134601 RepID=A0ABS6HMI6_MYCGD|nr:NADH:flavin oxidoreductase/NADH oxidase [Mycolicibacterium goodii]OKH65439.1 oxidoreductase [Mycobacterium sp. SWH-M5]MBU8811393.1 NADH:flavin oxidoreductase/NADH oxidase [Mycolicibacterium goodii]MBU8820101.1 NADH:flavin oxidoreductase/NADH oxidase [Mycolicibacterium goodii]MBU8823830.1 NADH:flavin oxidoreductase/NADH oxidase [Mycolicibacterium goodii]MBU8831906.1 NADH:flavin oxidoreductase/NADH oxidase [Mycolicibacterium goodii]